MNSRARRLSPEHGRCLARFPQVGGHGGVDDLGDDPAEWLSELRRRGAIDERRRQRWLETAMHESATMAELLRELAATQADVVVETSAGGRHAGSISLVGVDVVVVSNGGRSTVVTLAAVAAVRSTRHRQRRTGVDVAAGVDVTLLELLADRLDDRPDLVVTVAGGQRITGQLATVGHDLVVVHPDTPEPQSVHVAAATIVDVVIV